MFRNQFHNELSAHSRRYVTEQPVEYDLHVKPFPLHLKRLLVIAGIVTLTFTTSVITYAAMTM